MSWSLIDPAEIVYAPASASIGNSDTILFTCVAYGDAPTILTWIRSSDQFTLENGVNPLVVIYEETVQSGPPVFIQSTLQLCSAEFGDSSNYSCVASNGLANDSSSFSLTVGKKEEAILPKHLVHER